MDRNDLIRALRERAVMTLPSPDGDTSPFRGDSGNGECQALYEACGMLDWDQQVINGLLEYIEAVSAAAAQIATAAEEASKRVLDLQRATAEAADAARIMGIGGEAANNAKPDT